MDDQPSVLRVERHGSVAILTIDDPATKNALSPLLTREIVSACDNVNADIGIRCAILTAAGNVFCAGGNLKDMYARTNHFAGNAAEIRRTYLTGVQTIARALYDLEVPIIAAVNGPAMGAGMDFATMCTLRIASERAVFAESFIKLGLTSAAGGAWFLTRAIGAAAAAEMALTGDSIDAHRALELGLVSRVVPAEALMDEALSLANQIARHPAHSIRLNRRLLRESERLDLPAALEIAAAMQAVVQQTDDQHEAVASAVEKRAPAFTGR
ncbi:enoyl-CoA hydratase-related protein [Sphingomonas sp.]|uniref:enoyl-CoA hydratase-related protein n=1 Tax=Sphingomonas sp. TaxID=28214 RepID=UPI000CBA93BE|nr:enoyl-CoA hydratase-related protein [Sphingomonas sp.]MDK2768848.1 enoyl-CoA hydratase/isomerase family protein [Sphingomonas sp.]PKP93930.1 MAG: enoyl-CoA hydratase [Alphaproteobacteria bacterium HGW-Alphaproteobacteria-16]